VRALVAPAEVHVLHQRVGGHHQVFAGPEPQQRGIVTDAQHDTPPGKPGRRALDARDQAELADVAQSHPTSLQHRAGRIAAPRDADSLHSARWLPHDGARRVRRAAALGDFMPIRRWGFLVAWGIALVGVGLPTLATRATADEPSEGTVEISPEPEAVPPPEEEPPPAVDYTREGWYVQLQFAYGIENFTDLPSGLDVDDALGGNVAAGYRFHPLGALDLEFEYLDQFDFRGIDAQINRTFNISLNGRLYPIATLFEPDSIANRFQPFAKVGVAWMWVQGRALDEKLNDGNVAGRFGLGLDIYLTESIVLTAYGNYMLPNGDINDVQYASVGAGFQWRFGTPDY
jgi:hypothetical protein